MITVAIGREATISLNDSDELVATIEDGDRWVSHPIKMLPSGGLGVDRTRMLATRERSRRTVPVSALQG